MSDNYTDLVKRLRAPYTNMLELSPMRNKAADVIEAQAARIAHLEEMFHGWRDEARKASARIAELEKVIDVMYADGDKTDARVMRYKEIASKAIREQVAIREEYEAVISELKSALRPFIEEYEGWSENDYKYVPANVLRARSALARVKDSK